MQKSKLLIKALSNKTKTPQNWRTKIKHTNLVSQISSILQQRYNWPSILQTLNLQSKLTPPIFLQILNTTQLPPQVSLHFFNWAIKYTSFQPDFLVQCKLTHMLIGSGLVNPSKPILDSLIQNYPSAQIAQFMISCEKDSSFCNKESFNVFDCVIDWYCEKGLCIQAFEFFNVTRDHLSKRSCVILLNGLCEKNEVKVGLCFFGVVIRVWNEVLVDAFTLRIVAKMLSKEGRIEAMIRLIKMSVNDPVVYDLVIGCCCEMGRFEVALEVFDEMSERKVNPGFSTFAGILNGACRYKNDDMVKFAMEMDCVRLTDHDFVIQNLCDMRMTYAAEMLFKIACEAERLLENKTYGCMLRALSLETRVKEAIEIHRVIELKRVKLSPVFYDEFMTVLCDENVSQEVDRLLKDLISKGYKPAPTALSKYITSQCKKRRWKEAEEFAELAMQEFIYLEPSCCGLLIKRYCNRGKIDSAVNLHDRMVKQDYSMDSTTCNALMTGLLEALRVEEAQRMFDYMRIKKLLTSESFVIMIEGFCQANELRKGMKLHDEMLERGLKPSSKMYKRLICYFR